MFNDRIVAIEGLVLVLNATRSFKSSLRWEFQGSDGSRYSRMQADEKEKVKSLRSDLN